MFSTLHTNDAASAVTRLIDMGVEPFLVASSVQAIMAQRLVRRICPDCREAYRPGPELLRLAGLPEDAEGRVFYRGRGCPACLHTGYRGRIGVFELMRLSPALKNLLLRTSEAGAIRAKALERADETGMRTLRSDGIAKVLAGLTNERVKSAIEYTLEKNGSTVAHDSFKFETSLSRVQVPFNKILYFETSTQIGRASCRERV